VRVGVWLRLAPVLVVAAALLVTLSPVTPRSRIPATGAAAAGATAGLLLYLAVARRRPAVRPARRGTIEGWALLAAAAAGEEIVWRRVVLGELLWAGPVPALAASALGFALAHRARPGLHLGTGVAFGGLYLLTGALAAPIAAHWTYNVFLLGLAERTWARAGVP